MVTGAAVESADAVNAVASCSTLSVWPLDGSEEERVEVGEGSVEKLSASSESRLETENVDE